MLDTIRQIGDQLSRGWQQGQGPVEAARALGAASKPLLRDACAEVLARLGATSPSRFARGALTIVTFHRVLPVDKRRQYPSSGLVVTPEQLELVLGELAPHFECSSVIEAYRRWRHPGAPGARPPLGISFDDGALDNFEHARPVLEKLSLSATFYVPARNIEQRRAPWHDRLGFALLRSVAAVRNARDVDFDRLLAPFGLSVSAFAAILPEDALRLSAQGVATAQALPPGERGEALEALEAALGGDQVPEFAGVMSEGQLRELCAAGHEIGSQASAQPALSELPTASVVEEVAGSRRWLSEATGASVASFCHPGTRCDARVLDAVRAAGYECAVTTQWGINRERSAFELTRCDMDFERLRSRRGEFSKQRLWLRLSGLQPGLAERAS